MRAWLDDRRGATSILVAVAAIALVGFAAVTIDLGSVFLKSRQLQGLADLAATSAAADLSHAEDAAEATVGANSFPGPAAVETVTGKYTPDSALAPTARFVAGGADVDAARVTLHGTAPLAFAAFVGADTVRLTRVGTAARRRAASFEIGSGLLALDGGIANAVLSGLTGSSVSLTVMDYNALASARISLFGYLDRLNTNLSLNAASFSDVLAAEVTLPQALTALADALQAGGQAGAAGAARKAALGSSASRTVPLSALASLGDYGQAAVTATGGMTIETHAGDLMGALLSVADRNRQVALDLGAGVPGLASTRVWLAIGERPNHSPWLTVDSTGQTIISTAQTRLYTETKVGAGLGVLLNGGASLVTIPLFVELASGQAKLASIDCAGGGASLSVLPSIGEIAIAEADQTKLNDFKHPLTLGRANLLDLGLIKASAYADVKLGGVTWKTARFTAADIAAGTAQRVATDDVAQAATSSLLGGLDLDVDLLGLGILLGRGPVTGALQSVLSAAAPGLDTLLNTTTNLLGLKLGYADVKVDGLRCSGAALVA